MIPKFLFIGFIMVLAENSGQTQILQDILLVKQTIEQKHIAPFESCDSSAWNLAFQDVLEIPCADKSACVVKLIRTLSMLQDEHTMLFPKEELILPIRFKWVEEGAIVAITDSLNQDLLGGQLTALNTIPCDTIYNRISTLFKKDNPWYIKEMTEYFFSNTTVLQGLNVLGADTSCSLTIEQPDGSIVERKISLYTMKPNLAIDWVYAPFLTNTLAYHQNKNYWFEYLTDQNLIYFNFSRCQEDPNQPFKKFNKDLLQCIQKNQPAKIVVDLRSNPGGNSNVLRPFIQKIATTYLNQKGKLFVLIGKRVISSSLMNAVELKNQTHAIFIGQPSSGNLIHFGEIQSVDLQHLKARLIYSTRKFDLMNGTQGWLNPDIEVRYTKDKLLMGIDQAMQEVYAH